MLYRIDTPNGPVTDLLGPCLIRSWNSARRLARETVERDCVPVTITRIHSAGRTEVAVTYHPNATR